MVDLLDRLGRRPLAEQRLRGAARERPDPDEDEDREPEQDRDQQEQSTDDEPEHECLVESRFKPAAKKGPWGPAEPAPTAEQLPSRPTRWRRTGCRPGSARSR